MPCRYSPVGPIKILEQLQDADALGNYLLLVAHDVLADDIGYSLLLDDMHNPNDADEFIIMDNGVIELGKARPFIDVVGAAEVALPDCVVMPDVLGDYAATRTLMESQSKVIVDCPFPLMKVPQGSDLSQIVACIDWLHEEIHPMWPLKNYWGIPRWIANKFETRAPVIDYINRLGAEPVPQIHLLGMSDYWGDDLLCAILHNVMGIDSANPIVRGLLDLPMQPASQLHLPRGDYWEQTKINGTVLENIAYVREAIT
ncbi:hypothetical protein LCGC14_1993760 [marine sediment metagenome]|uniref:Uncharacterized protein n=1 Tax=marine sediment metagenome TaxID=412755 RepID=A0A0F9F528_9ZZZZ